MATTCYFEETIRDQGGKNTMALELGRSSFYAGCPVPNGIGEDSIYINVNGQSIVMDRATAARFIEAVVSVGTYHGLL